MGEIITDLARRGQWVDAAVLDGQVAQQGGLSCRRLADQPQKRRDGSLRRDSEGLQKRLLPILRKAQDSLLQRVQQRRGRLGGLLDSDGFVGLGVTKGRAHILGNQAF